MRILASLALVLAVAGCKRKQQPDETSIPAPAPPTAPALEPGATEQQATPDHADAPPAQVPTTDDVREQLAPALDEVRKCIAKAAPNAPPPDGAVAAIVVRIGVLPGGTIHAVEIDGREAARPCVLNALRGKVTLKPWVGPAIGVSIPISVDATRAPARPADAPGGTP